MIDRRSNTDTAPKDTSTQIGWKRSYLVALSYVIGGWAIGLAGSFVLSSAGGGLISDSVVIALASGLIACASMLSGILISEPPRPASSETSPAPADPDRSVDWSRFAGGLAIGMMIRLVGTVALFLTCRYHMATSTEMIAGMTIGWYVYLTSVEVIVLARELPKTAISKRAKAPHFPETSLG